MSMYICTYTQEIIVTRNFLKYYKFQKLYKINNNLLLNAQDTHSFIQMNHLKKGELCSW